MYTVVLRAAGVLLTAMLFAAPVVAQISVNPIKLTISARAKSEVIRLNNAGTQLRRFEIQPMKWSQIDGVDKLEPTEDVIVSPPVIALAPNKPQVLRVLRAVAPDATVEKSYRLLINEILPVLSGPATGVPRLSMNMRLPVFFAAIEPAVPDFIAEAKRGVDAENKPFVVLSIQNKGLTHIQANQLAKLVGGDENGEPFALFGYALPGASFSWRLDAQRLEDTQEVRVKFTNGTTRDVKIQR